MKRKEVYKLIDGERDYQDSRWNKNTTSTEGIHTPDEWIMFIDDYLLEAKHILSREAAQTGRPKAMNIMRKVAAMCVAAMEQNGCEPR